MATAVRVIFRKMLSPTLFILRFERKNIQFTPGQYINVGIADDNNFREYSIYSAAGAGYLEILVRTVSAGFLSPRLAELDAGDYIFYEGPFGDFTLQNSNPDTSYCLIATGSGFAPFHSMLNSRPEFSHYVLHGIRDCRDTAEIPEGSRCLTCVSGGDGGSYNGRVTDLLRENFIHADHYYLCGSSDMIYSVYALLEQHRIPRENIRAETYF